MFTHLTVQLANLYIGRGLFATMIGGVIIGCHLHTSHDVPNIHYHVIYDIYILLHYSSYHSNRHQEEEPAATRPCSDARAWARERWCCVSLCHLLSTALLLTCRAQASATVWEIPTGTTLQPRVSIDACQCAFWWMVIIFVMGGRGHPDPWPSLMFVLERWPNI